MSGASQGAPSDTNSPAQVRRWMAEQVDRAAIRLRRLSREIHADPETAFEEHRAAERCAVVLEEAGLQVRRGVFGLPTAFEATAGEGPFEVVVCCEYDALPGLGHACGHNIGAAVGVGAGLALAAAAGVLGVRVRVLGTPAEESGGGKALLLERGAFQGADAAMMAHASGVEAARYASYARATFDVEMHGRAAHAAAAPHLGRNAADALTVAQVALGLLRQHLPQSRQVHGITTLGGEAFNVIPERTAARYGLRAGSAAELRELRERVADCFHGGARAAGCEVVFRDVEPDYLEFRADEPLARAYEANARALGRNPGPVRPAASTDMGNVSHVIPSLHAMLDVGSGHVFPHQREFADHCVGRQADRAVTDGAVALAWTAADAAYAAAGVGEKAEDAGSGR